MNIDPVRVLLIEDNSHDAELVGRLLNKCHAPRFDVTVVRTFAPAFSLASPNYCDVVLLDMALPDSHGLEGLQQLAAAVPCTPIVVLTGFDDEHLAFKAIGHGAQDYLMKHHNNSSHLRRAICYAIKRKHFEADLAKRAHYDRLTGLANRALFEERLEHALARAKRTSGRAALMFIDLDEFKAINDGQGHEVGDEVLRVVAKLLRSTMRESETVARLGGDEFTVLMEPITDVALVTVAAERILNVFQKPLMIFNKEVHVTPSIGAAIFPDHTSDSGSLLHHADAAMFRAKRLGRNNFQVYEGSLGGADSAVVDFGNGNASEIRGE